MLKETIVSLVTAPITQNIALIRISGEKTYKIIEKIFKGEIPSYPQIENKIILGKIIDEKKNIVDEVLLLCFYKPHSFTGENVIEISCHGNLFIVDKILELIVKEGAVIAEKGEFSKRAFFNGKLDLIKAEAINDIIRSKTSLGTKIAIHNLNKEKSKRFEYIEEEILSMVANIKVNIDYPEHNEKYITNEEIFPRICSLIKNLKEIKKEGERAKFFQEGVKIAIIGKANVGKSSLLNALVKENRSIISSISGTTRDVIEAKCTFEGLPLIFLDTAGIRKETKDKIEKIGIKRSILSLRKADFVFFVVDNSSKWENEDEVIFQEIVNKKKNFLLVKNKGDKITKLKIPNEILIKLKGKIIKISAKKKNLAELENKIKELFFIKNTQKLPEYPFLSQGWQRAKITNLIKILDKTRKEIRRGMYLDALCDELEFGYKLIKELKGEEYKNELVDIIFKRFCLGK